MEPILASTAPQSSILSRLGLSIGRSAEYSIALALLAVCLICGAAMLALSYYEDQYGAQSVRESQSSSSTSLDFGLGENAEAKAVEVWRQRLQEGFSQIDRERQRRSNEQARLEQEKQQLMAAAQAQQQTPKAAASQSLGKLPASGIASAPARVAPLKPAPTPVRVPSATRIEASVDWTSCRRPDYPSVSVRNEEEGVVILRFDIDAQGRVLTSQIQTSSGHQRLDNAALNALSKCRFTPAKVNGVAQAASASLRFAWQLSKG